MSKEKREKGQGKAAGTGTRRQTARELSERKKAHLDICLGTPGYALEDTEPPGYAAVRFVHNALPELACEELDTTLDFLGCRLALPVFISCMTGGTARSIAIAKKSVKAVHINRQLARAAQQLRIPVGLGSIRALFSQPELFPDFSIKPLAPDVPVLANLGIVQLREFEPNRIIELLKRLEVQAIVIHLNPGQELMQPEGDRDFRHLKEALQRFCAQSPWPVIVKETGCGIKPSLVRFLFSCGVSYVDLAGAGGTNWLLVEARREEPDSGDLAREFDSWGLPTALLQAVIGGQEGRILASGGIRTGMDVAKALALGAWLAGLALPLLQAVAGEGVEGVLKYVKQLAQTLKTVMLLTGSRTLAELRQTPLLFEANFLALVNQLKKIERL